MVEWKECTLSELGMIVGGATPSTKVPENYENGVIPWITPKDLSQHKNRYISHGERNISERGLNSCSTRMMPKGTILFSSRAPIGYVAIATQSVCTNQGFKSIVPNNNVDSMFIYYLLKYKKDAIESLGSGTTFKEVSGNTMKNFVVTVPIKREVQSKIASVLGTLDDKIELNERINDNLLQQAKAIFDSYYDRATIQQSFTSMIHILGGGTPKTSNSDFWNGDIPFFTPKDVGSPYTFHTEKYITKSGLTHCNSRLYPKDTSFVTARGTVGKVSLAGKPMAMNQSCYAAISDQIYSILVYFYTLKVVESLKHKASGAVFDAIITRDFDTENISVLADNDSQKVVNIIKPMLDIVYTNSEENLYLADIRDTLLPKLISGELDVSDIDI